MFGGLCGLLYEWLGGRGWDSACWGNQVDAGLSPFWNVFDKFTWDKEVGGNDALEVSCRTGGVDDPDVNDPLEDGGLSWVD